MLKVAITGNIASGKSTVEGFLKDKGYKVMDTDKVAHDLLRDSQIKNIILESFQDFDIEDKGELSRKKLGALIFENKAHRTTLENILHPLIKEEIKHFFSANEKREKIIFVSVPLLFEAKFEDIFDKIILIYADDDIRIKRLIERNVLTKEMAKNRLGIQMSQDLKKPLVAHIIFNNGTIKELYNEVSNIESNLI